jgi:PAS domain S-box-containing protein
MAEPKSELRRQAEVKAAQLPSDRGACSADEARRILHELEVHQIELEMQNDELRRSRSELEIVRAKYFDLYDLAPVGYCTIDQSGLILEANFTAVNLLGVTRNTLVGQPIVRYLCEEDQDMYSRYRQKLFETGTAQVAELRMRRPDDTIFWANLESIVTSVTSAAPVCRLTISDISARKQEEAYREKRREVLEILNRQGDLREIMARILPAIRALTGCDALGIRLEDGSDFPYFAQVGLGGESLHPGNTSGELGATGGICRDHDGKVRLECPCAQVISGRTDPANPLFTKGGSWWTNDSSLLPEVSLGEEPRPHSRNSCVQQGHGSIALVPIPSGDGIVGLIQLNAGRKGHFSLNVIERLEEMALSIGTAVARRRVEEKLHLALEELRRSNLDLEQYAYVASHDLQEPLRIVTSFSKLLLDRYSAQLDEKAREYLSISAEAAERMSQLIVDLLMYSRVGLKRGVVPVDLGGAVEAALANLRVVLAETGAKLTRDPMPTIPVNLGEMAQVFQNLIGNALKFRRPGVTPEIHVGVKKIVWSGVPGVADGAPGAHDLRRDVWQFTVSDNGLGLDPRHAERIFTIFQRLHNRKQFPGTGVGLALCKKIIERQGGRIWAESEPGKGALFIFTLPA